VSCNFRQQLQKGATISILDFSAPNRTKRNPYKCQAYIYNTHTHTYLCKCVCSVCNFVEAVTHDRYLIPATTKTGILQFLQLPYEKRHKDPRQGYDNLCICICACLCDRLFYNTYIHGIVAYSEFIQYERLVGVNVPQTNVNQLILWQTEMSHRTHKYNYNQFMVC